MKTPKRQIRVPGVPVPVREKPSAISAPTAKASPEIKTPIVSGVGSVVAIAYEDAEFFEVSVDTPDDPEYLIIGGRRPPIPRAAMRYTIRMSFPVELVAHYLGALVAGADMRLVGVPGRRHPGLSLDPNLRWRLSNIEVSWSLYETIDGTTHHSYMGYTMEFVS